eukprot:1996677-Amphidinium_carterae.1
MQLLPQLITHGYLADFTVRPPHEVTAGSKSPSSGPPAHPYPSTEAVAEQIAQRCDAYTRMEREDA